MKNLKNLGKTLSSKEQKSVVGGKRDNFCGKSFCEVCGISTPGIQRCANRCRKWTQTC